VCLFIRGRGKNRTPPGRFAGVNWGSRPIDSRVAVGIGEGEEGPEMRRDEVVGEKKGETERIPTDCCGCLPTTRVSDNVVVAVADIFLFIFFIRRIRLAKCEAGQSADHTRSWKLNLMDEPFKPTLG